jgi:hypothetical protein
MISEVRGEKRFGIQEQGDKEGGRERKRARVEDDSD